MPARAPKPLSEKLTNLTYGAISEIASFARIATQGAAQEGLV
jgi:hypothetical protein